MTKDNINNSNESSIAPEWLIGSSDNLLEKIRKNNLTDLIGALRHDIEEHLPYFVFVESIPQVNTLDYAPSEETPQDDKYPMTGRLAFCGKDKAPIYSLGENGYYTLEYIEVANIGKYMYRTRPMKNEDNSGWVIPLYEGNDFSSPKSINAYFHNLMYWESRLPNNSFGPLTLRLSNSLTEMYRLIEMQGRWLKPQEGLKRQWMTRPAYGEAEKMQNKLLAKIRIEEIQNDINKKTDILRQSEQEMQYQTDTIEMVKRDRERLKLSVYSLKSDIENLQNELKILSKNVSSEQ